MEAGDTSTSKDIKFFSHVFSTTEEGKAEIINTLQYACLAIVPVVALNKFIQRFIPEANDDKSSIEIAVEILLQIVIMFGGILLIHRAVTYVPTYSGFRYEQFVLTNIVLAFLVIVLSIQTKLGMKVNILFDRLERLWNGDQDGIMDRPSSYRRRKEGMTGSRTPQHVPTQADSLGDSQTGIYPPLPIATNGNANNGGDTYDSLMRGNANVVTPSPMDFGPMAANAVLGSSFGNF